MPGESFVRPRDQFRFSFNGMKLNAPADTIPPNKYPLAINVRSVDDNSIRTRSGQSLQFADGGLPLTDIRTYAALLTGNAIRTLVRDSSDQIWLDTGALVGTLLPGVGGGNPPGVSMIPFRPNQSPNPYMYIANGQDYQKFSAPDAANAVVANQVGIAEPQDPCEAIAVPPVASVKPIPLGSWTLGGLATTLGTSHRVIDVVNSVSFDPLAFQYTVEVNTTIVYQRGMVVNIGATGNRFWVEDVYSSLPDPLTVLNIYYFTGNTGRCVIVLQNLTADRGSSASLYTPEVVASLRRGALIRWASGEVDYVLSVTTGPDGSLAIETSTTITQAAGLTITILPAIQVEQLAGVTPPATGMIIGEEQIDYVIPTPGVGYATAPVTGVFSENGLAFQPDDYLSFAVICGDPTQLIEAKLLFDVSNGAFNSDYYYYTIRPSDLTNAIANVDTQLAAIQTVVQRAIIDEETGATANSQGITFSSTQAQPGPAQWTQILIPISMLTRVGSDQSLTLQNVNAVRFLWNVLGNVAVAHDYTLAVWGGSQPDVGDAGVPYKYRVRPRSSVTGVKGNPSPNMRYGVSPRRQSVNVHVPGVSPDPQWDTNDIFRYGGAITQWRFIGSQRLGIGHTVFVDNFDDAAATAGDELEFDNFEPWPSIDFPLNAQTISVSGTTALVTIPAPTNVLRFLPGNLVLLGGQNAYTLWTRPIATGNPDEYLFQFVENAGSQTIAQPVFVVTIYEPAIARQFLPYMWGTDDSGTLFACGDPLRPGTVYFSKNNAPDSAPDAYNIEIVQPSEPLQGGEILDGRSFVASTERWWALYPQPSNPLERYNPVLQPLPRGLAAPFGHCNDGRSIFWWAKDGIWSSTKGSLTDEDLYNLFPHEGIPGTSVTYATPPVGRTIFPPDYTQAGSFRLTYGNYYLYATYKDTSGAYETLVYDTRRDAWCLDQYAVPVTAFCHPEQTADTLLMTDTSGQVLSQTPLMNDVATPIDALLATMEFDGGDTRAPKQWGDLYLDCIPAAPAGLILNPTSYSNPITAPIPVPTGAARVQLPINLGGLVVASTFGIVIQWTDDYTANPFITRLFVWQPSLTIQPAETIAWQTFGASFNMMGYGHIREIAFAYVSTAPITMTIASVDGQSPADVIIPSSAGKYNKLLLPLTANKGQLFNFKAISENPFQLFLDDCEIRIGQWSRQGPYDIQKTLGGSGVSSAPL